MADDDRHRPVTDQDLADAPVVDDAAAIEHPERGDVAETQVEPDLREVAAVEPRQTREDVVQNPAPDQVAATVERARRAIYEVEAREAYEQQAVEEHRAEQLGRWHEDDHTEDDADMYGAEDVADYQPAARE